MRKEQEWRLRRTRGIERAGERKRRECRKAERRNGVEFEVKNNKRERKWILSERENDEENGQARIKTA